MAEFPHFTKLLHFRSSPSLSSPLFIPLHHYHFPSLRRRLSLSISPNLLLLSSSLESDGSVVFKFGDASELPPETTSSVDEIQSIEVDVEVNESPIELPPSPAVENVDYYDTTSLSVETKIDQIDGDLAVVDQIKVEAENVSDEIAKDYDEEQNHDDVVVTSSEADDLAVVDQIEEESTIESNEIVAKDDDLVVTSSEVEDNFAGAPPLNHDDAVAIEDDNKIDVSKLDSNSEVVSKDKEVDDDESVKVIEDDEMVELPVLQLEAEPVLDEEVDDDTTDDHADEAFPSLVNSAVASTETTVDRALTSEDISSDSGDISTSHVHDTLPSVVQSDNSTESEVISKPTSPDLGPVSNSVDAISAEANPDSVQIPTVAVSVPSASLAKESDDICVAADPEQGISATTEISLREEISAPSLCLVSAAASLAHSTEALAGRDDAYFVCENWFGVADGVGQWSFGGINKGLYAQEFIRNCESLATKSLNTGLNGFKELFEQSAAMTESPGAARVLIAHIAEQVLHVANIGDTGFIVIRNRTVFMKSSPMFHEFNFPHAISSGDDPLEAAEQYHVELEDGDIIVTATDGLFDNIYEHDIASLVGKALEDGKSVKDIAELLASRSQEVGRSPDAQTPFADAAQAAGHTEISGGKFDHVTVIVSAVKKG